MDILETDLALVGTGVGAACFRACAHRAAKGALVVYLVAAVGTAMTELVLVRK
jgi:hypothetical protein